MPASFTPPVRSSATFRARSTYLQQAISVLNVWPAVSYTFLVPSASISREPCAMAWLTGTVWPYWPSGHSVGYLCYCLTWSWAHSAFTQISPLVVDLLSPSAGVYESLLLACDFITYIILSPSLPKSIWPYCYLELSVCTYIHHVIAVFSACHTVPK